MVKKILVTFFSKFTSAGISFILLLLTARYMGTDVRGEISLFVLGLAIVQTVNEIACGPALVYIIPQSNLRPVAKLVYGWVIIVSAISVFVLWLFRLVPQEWAIHLFVLSLLMALLSFHQQILLAFEKIGPYNFLLLLPPLLLLLSICWFIFYRERKDFTAYLWCVYCSQVPAFIAGLCYFFSNLKLSRHTYSPAHARTLIKNGLFNQLANIAHLLSNRISYYIIGTAGLVGIYSTGVSIIESVWVISNSAAAILLSRIVNSGNRQQSQQVTMLAARICLLLSFAGTVVLCVLPVQCYTYILGDQYAPVKPVLLLLSPGILFISFSTILCHYFSGTGKNLTITLANLSGFVITFLAAIVLIPVKGINGAAIATTISYFCSTVFLGVMFAREAALKPGDFIPGKNDWKLVRQQLKNLISS